jgi:hypothetical protein
MFVTDKDKDKDKEKKDKGKDKDKEKKDKDKDKDKKDKKDKDKKVSRPVWPHALKAGNRQVEQPTVQLVGQHPSRQREPARQAVRWAAARCHRNSQSSATSWHDMLVCSLPHRRLACRALRCVGCCTPRGTSGCLQLLAWPTRLHLQLRQAGRPASALGTT